MTILPPLIFRRKSFREVCSTKRKYFGRYVYTRIVCFPSPPLFWKPRLLWRRNLDDETDGPEVVIRIFHVLTSRHLSERTTFPSTFLCDLLVNSSFDHVAFFFVADRHMPWSHRSRVQCLNLWGELLDVPSLVTLATLLGLLFSARWQREWWYTRFHDGLMSSLRAWFNVLLATTLVPFQTRNWIAPIPSPSFTRNLTPSNR